MGRLHGRRAAFAAAAFLALCPPSRAQETPASPDSADHPAVSLFGEDPARQLSISGFGVGTYSYNFENDQNSFGDSVLAIAFSKVLSDHFSVFAQLTAAREADSPFVGAEEESGIDTDIDNLMVTWVPSARSGLQITFGKFDSPLAIERDDAPLNFQATESFTFNFARPVKFTGLQVHEAFSEHFELWGILANGWDVDHDNNKAKTGALYGMWSPSLAAHVGLGVIYGPEKDDRTGDARTTLVGTFLFQPSPSWVFGSELVYGSEPHSSAEDTTAKWYAGTLFTHHRFGGRWGATLRLDYMDDAGGSRTGVRQVLKSVTVSPQFLLGSGFFGIFRYLDRTSLQLPGFTVRLDLRYDRSTEPVFATRVEDSGRRDHFSTTLQTVFLF